MIALTQEKREELTAFINASIEQRCTVYTLEKQRELETLRDHIALASLTAVPFGWEIAGNIFPTLEEALNPGYIGTPDPIYDEPPVPEIKFPEKPDYSGDFTSFKDPVSAYKDGVVDGHRWYEKALKGLNGWGE
ncbi:hypothetical protein [Rosenbergiella nectarea]|uniref:hypothetical protein n=1 Tax=Rosenbergiella nectarea TaxID=988801 RepID=UPI001F4E8ABA|nr:hypothetical protein [Rosenbergiella nectarea]